MQSLTFWIIYPFLWIVSKLPWKLFYLFSDFICFIIYRIIGYRKKVVTDNLTHAFPEKSEKEITRIQKKFYSHMCDMFLEMVKSITISQKETQKRYKLINKEDLHKLESNGKSIVLLAAHYANYEWANAIDLTTKQTCVGVYKKVKNPGFDKLVKGMRKRFGSEVVVNSKIMRYAVAKERDETEKGKRIYGLIADQTPRLAPNNYFTSFMGREVPVFVGGEILAKKLDLNIAYAKVEKIKRGYYEIEIVEISDDSTTLDNFKASDIYIETLEKQIRKNPEYYLWTHKRWKHAR